MSDNPFAPYAAVMRGETPDDTTAPAVRGRRSAAPNSYMDPAWDDAEAEAEQATGVPAGVLRAIRVAGERSNGDQVSPVGARGVYQFMPATRSAFAKKYGVDAYSPDPTEQSTAAALHLKESYARTGDWTSAMAGYNGGISAERGTNTTKENRDYTSRVARAFNAASGQRGRSSPGEPSEPANPFMGLGELLAGDPPEAAPAPQPKQEGFLSSVVKNALPWMAEGVNTTAASLAGAADWAGTAVGIDTPDWGVRKFFEGNADTTRDWQSDSMQALIRQTDAETEKVRAEQGEWAAMKFRAAQLVKHPELAMRLGFTNAATIVPGMSVIKGAQLAGAGARLALGVGAATNAALNAGDAWGDSYDSIYKEAHKRALASGATPEQAAADAQDMARLGAQLPAAIGFITGLPAGATGLEAVVAGTARKSALGVGGALAKGGVADVVKAATNASGRTAFKRGLKSGLAEVGGELPEELLPAIAGNVALGELDGETTWSKGLGAHAVDTIAGAGPFGAYGGVRHARETRADAREMAKLLTDPSVPAEQKAAARDEIVAQARRAGVAPEQVDAWLDEQFMEDDAAAEAEAAERESASQADREAGEQRRAMDERVRASREAAERNQGLRDVLDRNLGMGEPTPGRDGAADMQAALDEPTGEMASDENGWERPQTAGERAAWIAGEGTPGVDLAPENPLQAALRRRGEVMGYEAAQAAGRAQRPTDLAPQAPAPTQPQTPAQQVASREAERNARGRKEFGIVKKQALATFADVEQALVDGLIDEDTYQNMAGLLAGDAARLAYVRGQLAGIQSEASAAAAHEQDMRQTRQRLATASPPPVDTAAIEADLNAAMDARDAARSAAPRAASEARAAPAVAPGVEFVDLLDESRIERGQRPLTKLERRRAYLAMGFDPDGNDPTGGDGERTPLTLKQIASAEEQLTGQRPSTRAVSKTLRSIGLHQKTVKKVFTVSSRSADPTAGTSAGGRIGSSGKYANDRRHPGVMSSDEDGAYDEAADERDDEDGAYDGVADERDDEGDGTVAGGGESFTELNDMAPDEARRMERESRYNDRALPAGLGEDLAKALGWNEALMDEAHDAQLEWDDAPPEGTSFDTLPVAAQAEWVRAFKRYTTFSRGERLMKASELIRLQDEIAARLTAAPKPTGKADLAHLPSLDPSLTGGIEGEWRADTPLHMVSDAKARMVSWVRAKVPGLGVGLGGLDSRGEKVTSNTVARGSTLERTLVAAYKSVADSPLGHLFGLVSPRLQSLTVFTGKGLQGVNGFFSRELEAVHLRINTELVEAAAGRIGGTVMTARVVGHEMGHATDWFAGKELGLKHFASVNPGGPLAIEVDTRADGTVNLELGPVMQELVGLYTGETYGQTDGTDRGAVPGDGAGYTMGQAGAGGAGVSAGNRVQQQVPEANSLRVERASPASGQGARAGGVEPAARQGAPRSAGAVKSRGRGSDAHTGLIAGLDFDQALQRLTEKVLPDVASGDAFTKAELADLVHDADTATKEALARLSEAYLADPEALQAEAPQAFALMEQLAKAKSLVEAGQLLAGMQPVKARKGGQKAAPKAATGGTTSIGDIEASREMPPPRVAERVNTSARDALQTGGDVFNAAKRAVMMLTDLVDVGKKYLPSSEKYLALLRRSQSDKGKAERGIASVMEDFYRLKSDAERGTGPGSVNAFLKASTEAKKWGFVPDWLPKGSVAVDPLMKAKFAALSPEAQKVVQRVFQHGHDSIQALREQALATIASEHDVALQAARKSGDAVAIKRAENAKLRASQDFANLADLDTSWPYAPLKRFGNFVVIARSNELAEAERVLEDHEADEAERSEARKRVQEMRKDAKHYGVWFREGRREARKLAEQVRAQGGFGKVENFARESQQYAARGDMMSAFYRLRDMVDNSTDEALREKSSQALRQLMADLHLSLLSEQSARQSGRRRDTVLGADDDMMRAFESQGRALAHFTASLHNNREIQDALAAMRREARDDTNAGTVEQRQDLFNEVLKRHMMSLDYRTGLGPELVSKAMAATSTWMLLTSLGYHINNATQPWAMSMPVMAAKHGYARAGKALIDAYKDVWPAIKDGAITQDDFAALPEDVRAAVNQLADDGSIMISLDSTYGRWSSTDNPVVSKVAHKLNRMAQSMEAVNRLATAVAAVRLERERGSDGVAFARQVIDKTHGEYADWNAPAFMRTPLGRLATQFRKFQIIQATLFVRMAYDAFKGASAEEKRTARVALGYSFMHMGLLGGLVGMPAFSLFSWLLGGLVGMLGGGDEPFDFEEWVRSKAGQSFLGRMATRGLPFAMGVDVSGRVGAGNMLSLLPYTDLKATRDGWSSIVAASMGPFVGGLMPRAWEGAGLMMNGQMWKGLEGFMPKGAQDFSKALRGEAQGVTNKRGDVLLRPDELSIMDGLLQGIGLPSTTVTERSYKASVKYRVEEFYKQRSDALQRQYIEAVRKGDDEAKQEVRHAWMETQAARRELGFKPQPLATLVRAAAHQHKRQQQTTGGIPFNKGNEKYVRRLVGGEPDDEDGDAGLEDDADEDDE